MRRLLLLALPFYAFTPRAGAQPAPRDTVADESGSARIVAVEGVERDAVKTALAPVLARVEGCIPDGVLGALTTWRFRLTLAGERVRAVAVEGEPEGSAAAAARCMRRALSTLRFEGHRGRGTVRLAVSREDRAANGLATGGGSGGLGLRPSGLGGGGTGGGTIGLGSGSSDPRAVRRRVTPVIRQGRAEVRGLLSRDIIRRVIRRHIDEVRYCYERELIRDPELRGRVSLRFVIASSGAVQAVQVRESTLANESVEGCLARVVRRWRFPEPEGGGVVVVTYPFVFSGARTAP